MLYRHLYNMENSAAGGFTLPDGLYPLIKIAGAAHPADWIPASDEMTESAASSRDVQWKQ